jgi:hypothetical protein
MFDDTFHMLMGGMRISCNSLETSRKRLGCRQKSGQSGPKETKKRDQSEEENIMKQYRALRFVLLMTLACSLTEFAKAQSASSDTVFVTVSVKNSKKEPVPGLKAQNFQILEDNTEQKITSFAENDGPWDIDLIVAHSKLLPGTRMPFLGDT